MKNKLQDKVKGAEIRFTRDKDTLLVKNELLELKYTLMQGIFDDLSNEEMNKIASDINKKIERKLKLKSKK